MMLFLLHQKPSGLDLGESLATEHVCSLLNVYNASCACRQC